MKGFSRTTLRFLWPFAVGFILLTPLLFLGRGTVLFWANEGHTPFWDSFFALATELGNAFTALILLPIVLRMKYKWLALYLLAFVLHVIFVHLFKQGLAADVLRPYAYYKQLDQQHLLQLVEGVKVRRLHSFPSGHTTTIFMLVAYFALLIQKRWASVLLVVVGVLVGFSRIYLVQHWFLDTYVGFAFGVLSVVLAYYLLMRKPKSWYEKKLDLPFLNRS